MRNFFQGSGQIVFDDKFLSLRFVKEALEDKFKIVVQEESSKYLKCKIVRYARLFGGPVPFPNPTLEVHFNNEDRNAIIQYSFTSHDYALAAVTLPILIFMGSMEQMLEGPKEAITMLLIFPLVTGLSILADTKYFSSRVGKALKGI